MSRGYLDIDARNASTGRPIPNASAVVKLRGTDTVVSVYTTETGTVLATLRGDLFGQISGWIAPGRYTAYVSALGYALKTQEIDITDTSSVTASEVEFTPTGTIAATDVQAAMSEVADDGATQLATHSAKTLAVHDIADTARLITIDNIGTYAPAPDLTTLVTLAPASSARNTIQPSADASALTLKCAVGQSALLLDFQSSAGSSIGSINAGGDLYFRNFTQYGNAVIGQLAVSGALGYTGGVGAVRSSLWSAVPSEVAVAVFGSAGQTADLQQWRNSAGVVVGSVAASGLLRVAGAGNFAGAVNLPGGTTKQNGLAWEDVALYRAAVGVVATDGDLSCITAGKGLKLKSPDGLVTRTVTIDNAGVLPKADVGLGSVDNTSDANKPVSTAQQAALAAKAATVHGHAQADVANLVADLVVKATIPQMVPGFSYSPPGSWGSVQFSNGALAFMRLQTRGVTIDQIWCQVQTAGSAGALVRLGLYADAGGKPGALLLDAGTVDATVAGVKTIAVNNLVLPVGPIWTAVVNQGAAATLPVLYGTGTGVAEGVPLGTSDLARASGFYIISVPGVLPDPVSTLYTTGLLLRAAIRIAP